MGRAEEIATIAVLNHLGGPIAKMLQALAPGEPYDLDAVPDEIRELANVIVVALADAGLLPGSDSPPTAIEAQEIKRKALLIGDGWPSPVRWLRDELVRFCDARLGAGGSDSHTLTVPRRFVVEAVLALEAANTIGERAHVGLHYGNHDRLIAEGRSLAASWFNAGVAALPEGDTSHE
jgi:hypothetical protein